MAWKALLASRTGFFVLGAAAVGALGGSSTMREKLRSVARQAIKKGILLSRDVQTFADKAREDWQDLVAEARAEIDGNAPVEAKHDHEHDHPH